MKDLYNILGLHRDATTDEIKRAYRRLAHQYHPDKNPSAQAEERFKEATAAYETLSDPKKRKRYDQFGSMGFNPGVDLGQNLKNIFSDLFKKRGVASSKRGKDRTIELTVDFNTAIHGGEEAITLTRASRCLLCTGTGAKPGTDLKGCHACEGSGEIRVQQGMLSVSKRCGYCHGKGRIIHTPCEACVGEGVIDKPSQLRVKIPPGTDTGTTLRYAGEGERGFSGTNPGDLKVLLTVSPHPVLDRTGPDLYCEIPVPVMTLILGGSVDVPTTGTIVRMKIPPQTQNGKIFRLRGKGAPALNSPERRGDQHVTVRAEIPTNLSAAQITLVQELRQLAQPDNYPEARHFWERAKD